MDFFSIKMRSSLEDDHISGHERIVKKADIEDVLLQLYKRGSRREFDLLNIKIEKIREPIKIVQKSLKLVDLRFDSFSQANIFAVDLLNEKTGISKNILKKFIDQIHTGACDGRNMRGAMIVDISGRRLEKDRSRGVRTSMVDFIDREKIKEKLEKKGFTERTLDALALSTKNLHHKQILAEYCISDETDYVTGYVAVDGTYYRLTPLKSSGSKYGGRIYFVKSEVNIEDLYYYLQKKPVLIKEVDIEF